MGRAEARNRIILALDVPSLEESLELVRLTREFVGMYKVGMELFYSVGASGVRTIADQGGKVFLDLKLHDIPATVERTARVLASIGVSMFNVHCLGGLRMMQAAVESVRQSSESEETAKIIGVTMLTSLSETEAAEELGMQRPLADQVTALAALAKRAGLDGVVASPLEAGAIKDACGRDFLVVTPGVRPSTASTDDQRRVMTPGKALRSGADHIVIGRPITRSADPRSAAAEVLAEVERELEDCTC